MIGGNLYCIISVWDEAKKQWVSKMDVGTESYTEKEKGQASDSFKRACVSLGIGRELYTAPYIWLCASKVRIEKRTDNNGRGKEKLFTYDKFKVTSISYNNNREIIGLTIINQDGKIVYFLNDQETAQQNTNNVISEKEIQQHTNNTPSGKASPKTEQTQNSNRTQEINKELARTGVALDTVLERYGVSSIQEMDSATYKRAINSLKKTKAKAA